MRNNSFLILGTLRNYTLEFKGKNSDFPIVTVEVQTGEKFYETQITGSESVPFQALLETMPIGTAIRAGVELEGRRGQQDPTKVYTSLKLTSLAPDFSGRTGTIGTMTGVVGGIVERQGKTSSFKVPMLKVLLADRNGLITDHAVEVRFTRDGEKEFMPIFESQAGDYAEIEAELDAFITDKGGSIVKFQAKKVAAQPLPEYLQTLYAPVADVLDDAV